MANEYEPPAQADWDDIDFRFETYSPAPQPQWDDFKIQFKASTPDNGSVTSGLATGLNANDQATTTEDLNVVPAVTSIKPTNDRAFATLTEEIVTGTVSILLSEIQSFAFESDIKDVTTTTQSGQEIATTVAESILPQVQSTVFSAKEDVLTPDAGTVTPAVASTITSANAVSDDGGVTVDGEFDTLTTTTLSIATERNIQSLAANTIQSDGTTKLIELAETQTFEAFPNTVDPSLFTSAGTRNPKVNASTLVGSVNTFTDDASLITPTKAIPIVSVNAFTDVGSAITISTTTIFAEENGITEDATETQLGIGTVVDDDELTKTKDPAGEIETPVITLGVETATTKDETDIVDQTVSNISANDLAFTDQDPVVVDSDATGIISINAFSDDASTVELDPVSIKSDDESIATLANDVHTGLVSVISPGERIRLNLEGEIKKIEIPSITTTTKSIASGNIPIIEAVTTSTSTKESAFNFENGSVTNSNVTSIQTPTTSFTTVNTRIPVKNSSAIESPLFSLADDVASITESDAEAAVGKEFASTTGDSVVTDVSETVLVANDVAITGLLGRFTDGVVTTLSTTVTTSATGVVEQAQAIATPIISTENSRSVDVAEIQLEPILQGYIGQIHATTADTSTATKSTVSVIESPVGTVTDDTGAAVNVQLGILNSDDTLYLQVPGSAINAIAKAITPDVGSSVFSSFDVSQGLGTSLDTSSIPRGLESPPTTETNAEPVLIGDPFTGIDLGDVVTQEVTTLSASETTTATPRSKPTQASTEIRDQNTLGITTETPSLVSTIGSPLVETTTRQIVEYPFTITDFGVNVFTATTPQATDTGEVITIPFDTTTSVDLTTAFDTAEIHLSTFDTLTLGGEFIATEPATFFNSLIIDIAAEGTESIIHATTDDIAEILSFTTDILGSEIGIGLENAEIQSNIVSILNTADLSTTFETGTIPLSEYATTQATVFSQSDIDGIITAFEHGIPKTGDLATSDDESKKTLANVSVKDEAGFAFSDDLASVLTEGVSTVQSDGFSFAIDNPSVPTTEFTSVVGEIATYRAEGEIQESEASSLVGEIEAIGDETNRPAIQHVPLVKAGTQTGDITIDLRISGTVTDSTTDDVYTAKTQTGVSTKSTIFELSSVFAPTFSFFADEGGVSKPVTNARTVRAPSTTFSDDTGSVTTATAESPTTLTDDLDVTPGSVTNSKLIDVRAVSDTFSDDTAGVTSTQPIATLRAKDVAFTDDASLISPTVTIVPASLDLAFTDVPGEAQPSNVSDVYEANAIGLEDVDLANVTITTTRVDSFTFSDDDSSTVSTTTEPIIVADAQTFDGGTVTLSDEPASLNANEHATAFEAYPQGGKFTPINGEFVARVDDFAQIQPALGVSGRTFDLSRTDDEAGITDATITETLSANEEGIATLTHVQDGVIVTAITSTIIGLQNEYPAIVSAESTPFSGAEKGFTTPSIDIVQAQASILNTNDQAVTGDIQPPTDAVASLLSANEEGIGIEGDRSPTVLTTDNTVAKILSAQDFAFSDDASSVMEAVGTGLWTSFLFSDDTGEIVDRTVTPTSADDLSFTDDASLKQTASLTILFGGDDNENAITYDPGQVVDSTLSIDSANEHIRLNLGLPADFHPGPTLERQFQVTTSSTTVRGNDGHATESNFSDIGYGVTDTLGEDGHATGFANTSIAPPAALHWQATGRADATFTLTETFSDDTGEVTETTVSTILAPSGTFSDDNPAVTEAQGVPQDGELHGFTDVPGSVETDQVFGMRALGTGVQSSVSGLVTLSITPVARYNVRFDREKTFSDDTGEIIATTTNPLNPVNGPDDSRIDLLADIKQATVSPLSANDNGIILQRNVKTKAFTDTPSTDDLAFTTASTLIQQAEADFAYRGQIEVGITGETAEIQQVQSTILTPYANNPLGNNAIAISDNDPINTSTTTLSSEEIGIQIDTSPPTQITEISVIGDVFSSATASILPVDVVADTPPADERSRKVDSGNITEFEDQVVLGEINAIQIVNDVRDAVATPIQAISEEITVDNSDPTVAEFDTFGITDAAFIEEGSVTGGEFTTYVALIEAIATSDNAVQNGIVTSIEALEIPRNRDSGDIESISTSILSDDKAIASADIPAQTFAADTFNSSAFGTAIESAEILLQNFVLPFVPNVPVEIGIGIESPVPPTGEGLFVSGKASGFADDVSSVSLAATNDVGSKTFIDLNVKGSAIPITAGIRSGEDLAFTDVPGSVTETTPSIIATGTETIAIEEPTPPLSEATTKDTIVTGIRLNLEGEIQPSDTNTIGNETAIAIDGTVQDLESSPIAATSTTFAADDSEITEANADGTEAIEKTTVIDESGLTETTVFVVGVEVNAITDDISDRNLVIGDPVLADGGTITDDVGDLISGISTPQSADEKPKISIKSDVATAFVIPRVAATNGGIVSDNEPVEAVANTIAKSESRATVGSVTTAESTPTESIEEVSLAGVGSVTASATATISATETIDLLDQSEFTRGIASPIASTEFITSLDLSETAQAVGTGVVDVESIRFDEGGIARMLGSQAVLPETIRIDLQAEYSDKDEFTASVNDVELQAEHETDNELVARYDLGKNIRARHSLSLLLEGSVTNDRRE